MKPPGSIPSATLTCAQHGNLPEAASHFPRSPRNRDDETPDNPETPPAG